MPNGTYGGVRGGLNFTYSICLFPPVGLVPERHPGALVALHGDYLARKGEIVVRFALGKPRSSGSSRAGGATKGLSHSMNKL